MNVKVLFSALVFSIFSTEVAHGQSQNQWLFEEAEGPNIKKREIGLVDGEEYVAIITDRRTPEGDYSPAILVFRTQDGTHQLIADIDLHEDYTESYDVRIKRNSIFLWNKTAHHGVYSSRYQFKKIEGEFRLIGTEDQAVYSTDIEGQDGVRETWDGTSINLLTSQAERWRKTYEPAQIKAAMSAYDSLKKEEHPRDGIEHCSVENRQFLPLSTFDFENRDVAVAKLVC